MKAPINHIIDSSFIDGPGNRTVIFFQGCNFHCAYCHNPETINECINCMACVDICPTKSLYVENDEVKWVKETCTDCGICYKNCRYFATPRVEKLTPHEVMDRVKKNMPFIRGITVSGGECSLRRDFLVELFTLAKDLNLSTLMDSNGSYRIYEDEDLLKVTDGVMLDVKAFDVNFHKLLVNKENDIVLENLVNLAKINKLQEVRTVVLGNNEFSKNTVINTGKMLKPYLRTNDIVYKLIKYRPIGVRSDSKLLITPSDGEMQELKNQIIDFGFSKIIIT